MANITLDERIERQKAVVFNFHSQMEMMRRSKWRWNMC